MLDVLEKLLILQERDRKIAQLHEEIAAIEPQRQRVQTRTARAQATSESAKQQLRHLETDRKRLELEVEGLKQQIERYSLQQFQTKKNDEYRALAHEIETARSNITRLEDNEIEIMEQAERVQKEAGAAAQAAAAAVQTAAKELADLQAREDNLRTELARLETDRNQLTTGIDPAVLSRYERLRKNKGERVIVGIDHGCCGGCHMRLPAQILIVCQADQEIPTCPNCARILYYTRDMSLAAAE